MAKRPKCPKCKRDWTWSEEFQQCSACGEGWEKVTDSVTTSLRDAARMTGSFQGIPAGDIDRALDGNVTHNVTGGGGRHCSTCTCAAPKAWLVAERQYREY